ncbi:hypothetical protein [Streptomyces sp. NPDC016172]|uniref:hypothetical protein n=1 Tax=Streptomyces sp. NPDC016172 TaxID=3364964 RepID=UPI0036F729AA
MVHQQAAMPELLLIPIPDADVEPPLALDMTAVYLVYVEGFTVREIADIMLLADHAPGPATAAT